MDRAGKLQPIPASEQQYTTVDMSPDGRRLSVGVGGANNVQWAYDLERNQMTRLTTRFDVEGGVWTHDGLRVTYWSGTDIRSVAADGSGKEEVLISASVAAGRRLLPESWSQDGQTLSLSVYTPGKGSDVGLYSPSTKTLNLLVASRFDESGGRLSPDGKWLAFVSDESTRPEVYVRATDGSSGKHPVTSEGAEVVLWTTQGRELLYPSPKGLMAASFTAGPTPSFGKPVLLFHFNDELKNIRGATPSPDGKRFAVLLNKPLPPLTEIRVVTNWTLELARQR